MNDDFEGKPTQLDDPMTDGVAITTSNDNDLPNLTRAIWVGGTGTIAAILKSGKTVTFTGVPAGTMLRVRVSRVLATGTTATNMVALW